MLSARHTSEGPFAYSTSGYATQLVSQGGQPSSLATNNAILVSPPPIGPSRAMEPSAPVNNTAKTPNVSGDAATAGPTIQARRVGKTRLRKWASRAAVLLLLPPVAGFTWDQVETWRFLRKHPPPGEVFQVDGVRLHAVTRGKRTADQPAVIIEPGMKLGRLRGFTL